MAGNKIKSTELSEDEGKEYMEPKNVRENEIKQAEEKHTRKIESAQEEYTKLEKAREDDIKQAEENDIVTKIDPPCTGDDKGVLHEQPRVVSKLVSP